MSFFRKILRAVRLLSVLNLMGPSISPQKNPALGDEGTPENVILLLYILVSYIIIYTQLYTFSGQFP